MNIAILGFGTVGSGVYEILKNNKDSIKKRVGEEISVKHILDIRDFSSHPDAQLFTNDYNVILNDASVKVVAEVIGGIEPSLTFTKEALRAGKSVVTSNKELVATHGAELFEIAKENNCSYLFEAAVGGGIPLIRPVYKDLAANNITKIMGILNGTTNYILTKMINEGKAFDSALKTAQELGYAERNPEADIEGHDTCRKIAILSSLVSDGQVDSSRIYTEGITKIDPDDVAYGECLGAVIKLVGYSEINKNAVYARVSPMYIKKDHPLASAQDVFNAAMVTGDSVGDVMFYGKGAGKLPTASAVLGDVIDLCLDGSFIGWGKNEVPLESDADSYTGAFVRISDKNTAAFESKYGITPVDDVVKGEKGYVIPCISEKELKTIDAIKIIRTEKNFI
ncbi:MAG: homoserine dehydrogenase [Clostridia bacterium]|nr:homoserine dehydrogenase [Clostridia bacterium]